ncbi:hypothetical protein QTN25_006533 [Entamoeba marina]
MFPECITQHFYEIFKPLNTIMFNCLPVREVSRKCFYLRKLDGIPVHFSITTHNHSLKKTYCVKLGSNKIDSINNPGPLKKHIIYNDGEPHITSLNKNTTNNLFLGGKFFNLVAYVSDILHPLSTHPTPLLFLGYSEDDILDFIGDKQLKFEPESDTNEKVSLHSIVNTKVTLYNFNVPNIKLVKDSWVFLSNCEFSSNSPFSVLAVHGEVTPLHDNSKIVIEHVQHIFLNSFQVDKNFAMYCIHKLLSSKYKSIWFKNSSEKQFLNLLEELSPINKRRKSESEKPLNLKVRSPRNTNTTFFSPTIEINNNDYLIESKGSIRNDHPPPILSKIDSNSSDELIEYAWKTINDESNEMLEDPNYEVSQSDFIESDDEDMDINLTKPNQSENLIHEQQVQSLNREERSPIINNDTFYDERVFLPSGGLKRSTISNEVNGSKKKYDESGEQKLITTQLDLNPFNFYAQIKSYTIQENPAQKQRLLHKQNICFCRSVMLVCVNEKNTLFVELTKEFIEKLLQLYSIKEKKALSTFFDQFKNKHIDFQIKPTLDPKTKYIRYFCDSMKFNLV